jgi:hypothetical protein
MGRACSMHGRDEKCLKILVREYEGRDHLEKLDADGRYLNGS